jgi:uncharacterized protein involved in response to NO
VPQLELHGSSHVYYLQAWIGDAFLLKVLQLVCDEPSPGWQDELLLLEKLLVFVFLTYLQAMEGKICWGAQKLGVNSSTLEEQKVLHLLGVDSVQGVNW